MVAARPRAALGPPRARAPPRARRAAPPRPRATPGDGDDGEGTLPDLDATPTPRAAPRPPSLPPAARLRQAAASFAAAVDAGASDEDAAAAELGAAGVEGLTEAQRVYAAKVAARLREAADAEAAAKKARAKRFETGKVLYGVGRYKEAVAALVAALDAEGPFSILGGEIQLWLALAHQAAGDEQACLAVYRQVEAGHPSPKMRKQAADLRYIMEAPKLRVGPDEKPTLPSVDPASPRAPGERTRRRVPSPPRGGGGTARPKTLEERWAEDWTPPALIPNQYVAIAVAAVAAGLAVYSAGVK